MLYGLQMYCIRDGKVYDSRLFGIYTEEKLDALRNIVINNVSDIWEYYYKYAVIVKIPENMLYVDCYYSILEGYEVVIPKELKEAKALYESGQINHEGRMQIERDNCDKVKYKKIENLPECITERFSDLYEQEFGNE